MVELAEQRLVAPDGVVAPRGAQHAFVQVQAQRVGIGQLLGRLVGVKANFFEHGGDLIVYIGVQRTDVVGGISCA
ncbi:hypothetical protein D3C72_2356080 [compost metagenome]